MIDWEQTLASGTSEFQEAQHTTHWARALRRIVKRRQALRTAAPFTAAIVAVAESWIYKGGVLCYIQDRTLRVLDLHRAGSTETVVDIRGLLQEAVNETRHRKRYKLQLLHYAVGLVTCLYSRGRENWLIVFDVPKQRLLAVSPTLESTFKIFVRNDADFLYYGTHSDIGEDGHRKWVLMTYDIGKDEWSDRKIHLVDMVGSDIGQSICFEILDGQFYGLSNQTSFEVDEVDWTSYYHCFCFPVGNPDPRATRRSIRDKVWRRQHAEGPIDDRWSFIRLCKNEEDCENLQILESRKEWLEGRSSGQRTYYTTPLALGPKLNINDDEESQNEATDDTTTAATPNTIPSDVSYSSSTSNDPPDSARLASGRRTRTNFTPPPKTTTRLRDPHNTHIGDDASTGLLFTFSKCPVRSYHVASQAFLDLVEDPTAPTTQLKLRAGARHALAASDIRSGSPAFDTSLPHTERIKHLYKNSGANEIVFWPPTSEEGPDASALKVLETLMNPPSHPGNVQGTWDERSFVYSTGNGNDGMQAVIFLGFDPAIKLRGIQDWGSNHEEGWCDGATRKEEEKKEAAGMASMANMQEMPLPVEVCGGPFFEDDDKGKDVAVIQEADDFAAMWAMEEHLSPQTIQGYSSGEEEFSGADATATWSCSSPSDKPHSQLKQQQQPQQQPDETVQGELQWARELPAMYQEINFGFNGLPDFTQQKKIRKEASIGAEKG